MMLIMSHGISTLAGDLDLDLELDLELLLQLTPQSQSGLKWRPCKGFREQRFSNSNNRNT